MCRHMQLMMAYISLSYFSLFVLLLTIYVFITFKGVHQSTMISVEEQDTFINQNHQTRFSNCQGVPQTPLLPIYRQAQNAHRDLFLWNKRIPSVEGIEGAKKNPTF